MVIDVRGNCTTGKHFARPGDGSDACLTGIQEVAGLILWSSNILSWTGHEIIS